MPGARGVMLVVIGQRVGNSYAYPKRMLGAPLEEHGEYNGIRLLSAVTAEADAAVRDRFLVEQRLL